MRRLALKLVIWIQMCQHIVISIENFAPLHTVLKQFGTQAKPMAASISSQRHTQRHYICRPLDHVTQLVHLVLLHTAQHLASDSMTVRASNPAVTCTKDCVQTRHAMQQATRTCHLHTGQGRWLLDACAWGRLHLRHTKGWLLELARLTTRNS